MVDGRTIRRWIGTVVAGLAAAGLGEAWPQHPSVTADARAELARSVRVTDSLRAAAGAAVLPGAVAPGTAVTLAYLERLRLGLGSPFRLVDQARQDPRLSPAEQHTLAWALLAHTLAGDGYQVEPVALDAASFAAADSVPGAAGARHLRLIDETVRDAADPRAGELAVRLGYTLARAERTVSAGAPMLGARAAALVRDRELARRDAVALLDDARRTRLDPLLLVAAWRADRRFEVERPPLDDAARPVTTRKVVDAAEQVASALRPVADSVATTANAVAGAPRAPWLTGVVAERLAELASVRSAPPEAAVTISVRGRRSQAVTVEGLSGADAAARARFVARATNAEALVAERVISGGGAGVERVTATAMLDAAVALRPFAQEPVWFPGFPAPTATEIKQLYGVAAVSFDRTVPREWRPYYLRMLALSLGDMQRVLPELTVRGLGVHFGESVMRDTALALHDPATRTVFFPVGTGAGTIAHELAHDLDWQAARTQRRVHGDYLTDRAVREGRGRLAAALSGLAGTPLTAPAPGTETRPSATQRPTEVFARSVDWFVTAALAREGRENGYLSTVQDDVLTGYTLVAAPDAAGRTGQATIDALDDITTVPAELRQWFSGRYGTGRPVGGYDEVRQVLALPRSSLTFGSGSSAVAALPPGVLPAAGGCTVRAGDSPRSGTATSRLAAIAAEARVRGTVRFVGPWRDDAREERMAMRVGALLDRLQRTDASRDPMSSWLRAHGACE